MKRNIKWEYSKLKGKIKEVFNTQEAFAKEIGISSQSFNYKLNNQIQFRQEEIYRMMNLLNLEDVDIKTYFFTPFVEKTQQTKSA